MELPVTLAIQEVRLLVDLINSGKIRFFDQMLKNHTRPLTFMKFQSLLNCNPE